MDAAIELKIDMARSKEIGILLLRECETAEAKRWDGLNGEMREGDEVCLYRGRKREERKA